MGRLDAKGIDVARIIVDAHAAEVGVHQAVAGVTIAAAAHAPAPTPAAAAAPAPASAGARVPAPAPAPAPDTAPVAAAPVREAIDPWAPPAPPMPRRREAATHFAGEAVSMRSHPRSPVRPGSFSRPGAGGHGEVLFTPARCAPFVIALGVLGIELSPAHDLVTGPILTTTPALAALTMGPIGTLSAAALAAGVNAASATYNQSWGTQTPLIIGNFLGIIVVSVAGVILSNGMRTRRQSEPDQVRRIAVTAQEIVLRPVPELMGPIRAASLCLAAGTGAQVGGDLYTAVQTRYGVRLIVGDVRGKGLSAIRTVAVALGAFREAVHYENEAQEVMNHCAAALRREATAPGTYSQAELPEVLMEGFTTALIAQVPDEHVVHLVNRGHPPPLVLHEGQVLALMPASPMPPLGLEDLVNGLPTKPERYPLLPGDRLLLYTDGVIEARNRENDFLPLPETATYASLAALSRPGQDVCGPVGAVVTPTTLRPIRSAERPVALWCRPVLARSAPTSPSSSRTLMDELPHGDALLRNRGLFDASIAFRPPAATG
ncbi:PP2C family protein-serine/threonine phosphatase [Streptomyces sp. NPDC001568]|uniref:PP2C family protein-serine/threonine phosphatase n=1 Tax=Streptomyces sp. NPDC001568 TaxID=3364588 RepID=UPI00369043F2